MTWLKQAIPLDRPEYSKQTEALLTDLLWRSPGSSLYLAGSQNSYLEEHLAKRTAPTGEPLDRIVYAKTGKKTQKVVESLPIAQTTNVQALIDGAKAADCLHAILETLKAPRSRSYRSVSSVPLHPDLVVLQTLPGIVNKQSPPNVARIIEEVGRLGGSDGVGAVASRFLRASQTNIPATSGISGCVGALFPRIAEHVWAQLGVLGATQSSTPWPDWPRVVPQPYAPTAGPVGSTLPRTPFRWFWDKWQILCDPANGWTEKLPQRRWVDWSLSLLRTALAFAYLWEAELFCRIRDRLVERNSAGDGPARERLNAFLEGQFTLAPVQPSWVPPSQKRVWDSLSSTLAKGYVVRKALDEWIGDSGNSSPSGNSFSSAIVQWIDGLSPDELRRLAGPIVIPRTTANNTKEFVKYLMLPRSADDDSSDQGDLYFLARSNRSSFWVELGPEWLVVETALLARRPDGKCTLRQLLDDIGMLGISIDRRTLVTLLEEAGLSADSPDADDALVIESGF